MNDSVKIQVLLSFESLQTDGTHVRSFGVVACEFVNYLVKAITVIDGGLTQFVSF